MTTTIWGGRGAQARTRRRNVCYVTSAGTAGAWSAYTAEQFRTQRSCSRRRGDHRESRRRILRRGPRYARLRLHGTKPHARRAESRAGDIAEPQESLYRELSDPRRRALLADPANRRLPPARHHRTAIYSATRSPRTGSEWMPCPRTRSRRNRPLVEQARVGCRGLVLRRQPGHPIAIRRALYWRRDRHTQGIKSCRISRHRHHRAHFSAVLR